MSEIEKAKDELRKEFQSQHVSLDVDLKGLIKEVSNLTGKIDVMIDRWDSIKTDTTGLKHKTDHLLQDMTEVKVTIKSHQKSIDDWADVRKKVFTWIIISVIAASVAASALITKGGS